MPTKTVRLYLLVDLRILTYGTVLRWLNAQVETLESYSHRGVQDRQLNFGIVRNRKAIGTNNLKTTRIVEYESDYYETYFFTALLLSVVMKR